jgi:hypothetical protein
MGTVSRFNKDPWEELGKAEALFSRPDVLMRAEMLPCLVPELFAGLSLEGARLRRKQEAVGPRSAPIRKLSWAERQN